MWFLTVMDILLSSLVVGPCVVGFWRGTWEYMEAYRSAFPLWWTLWVSGALHLVFTLLRQEFAEQFRRGGLRYIIISRCYIYVFSVSCAMQWRSTWMILEDCINCYDVRYILLVTVPSTLVLFAFRLFCNTLAPPYCIALDFKPEDVFMFPTMFNISGTRETWLYVLDCFFSVFVIGTLVVFVWRGFWCLLDNYLFPDRPDLSALGSLAMGYFLVFATFATQPLMKALVSRIDGFWRILAVDIYLIFSFCGTVNVWRGVWNTLNIYFLPETPIRSYWVSHVVSFVLLIFINSSNSILVRGVYIDAEEQGAQCVDFPCYYLRLFFQTKRKKKLLAQLQKRQVAALARRKSEGENCSGGGPDLDLGAVNHLQKPRASIVCPTDSQNVV
ncbi:uncharacterized protein LOC124357000 isoform X4 [Homalodisca vitripennis]|uniref:uncharacterized protein LOC124357000 isoform X3 n=1 Tax=Homalodisca vitripennis TaxID=197043 RepID=UPI001EE9B8C9|nr:uncharacterized protein LOC124357000 isoform X3 [Homalodisca vitripennis]XP_046664320.1 uncharacterized protein LOC124357000 isoform X3 [Homalodisca vitripennis]XP_046664321.1 uncharacterized protein LOC124357000 isoform X4 [Homalodisca vitripennis]